MALSLDSSLGAAQDSMSRRPIVQLISSPLADIYPLRGNLLNTLPEMESNPSLIVLEEDSGRMAALHMREGSWGNQYLHYLYTDVERTEWTTVPLTTVPVTVTNASLCEIEGGNVGIVLAYTSGSDYVLAYMVIDSYGNVLQDVTTILSDTDWKDDPYVENISDSVEEYLLVYSGGTGEPPSISNEYHLYQINSAGNFTSWNFDSSGGPSYIALSGLADERYKGNPHLLQHSSGRIFLHFDYLSFYVNEIEVNNIFMVYSDNGGATWSTPQQITDYEDLGLRGIHPVVAEKGSGDLTYAYHEEATVKRLTTGMDNFPDGYTFNPDTLWYDATNDKLYIDTGPNYTGGTSAIMAIDVPTWTFERHFSDETSPSTVVGIGGCGPVLDGFSMYLGNSFVGVIDHTVDSIKFFGVNADYNPGGLTYNIKHWGYICPYNHLLVISQAWMRQVGNQRRLYLYLECSYFGAHQAIIWVDYDSLPDVITGLYDYEEVWHDTNRDTANSRAFHVEEQGWIVVSSPQSVVGTADHLFIIHEETGAEVKHYNYDVDDTFPKEGVRDIVYVNGYFWFSFNYWSGQPDKRGLARLDVNDDSIVYFQPPWVTVNDYDIWSLYDMGDNRILMTIGLNDPNGGVAIFDTTTNGWTFYNSESLPGMLVSANYSDWNNPAKWKNVAYDPATQTIFAGYHGYGLGDQDQVISFSEYGAYGIIKFGDVTTPIGTPAYGESADLSYYDFESQPVIAYDTDNILWGLWIHYDGANDEYSITWTNAIGDKDMTDDISLKSPVEIEWDIENPNKLSFTLSRGHLYDTLNFLSIFSVYLKKGRKITAKFGENISGSPVYQDQGTFLVTEASMKYLPGIYPEMKVKAEDVRALWEDSEVIATQYYENQTPKNIIENILYVHADLDAGEYNIPTLAGSHDIDHQFIDVSIADMLKEILEHFMYYSFVDVDGIFEPRLLDLSKAADHAYEDTSIVEYSPDFSYSTFINRVVVKGETDVFYEVLYEEESITSLSGTIGWWGEDQNKTVWYSEDQNRTVRYPRLEVIQSVRDFEYFGIKGGGSEYISDDDPDEHYCIVKIEGPNLVGAFISGIAALIAIGLSALGCTASCGGHIFAAMVATNFVFGILGCVATYNYNVWGRPVGHEKFSIQGEANDTEYQDEIGGKIITETIEDPFCYTVQSCNAVADNELSIVKAQRRRLKFKKIAHLQDEVGDVIEIPHPYSGETIRMFITNLKRIMKISEGAGSDGYFIDQIEGWRLLT